MSLNNIFVVSDEVSNVAELVTGAKTLGSKVVACVFSGQDADKAVAGGADKAIVFNSEGVVKESFANAIASEITSGDGELVLVGVSTSGKVLAGLIASALKTAVISNVSDVTFEDGVVTQRMVYGGAAIRKAKSTSKVPVITVPAGVFAAQESAANGEIVISDAAPSDMGIKIVETRVKNVESVNLAVAKRIVGVGRGFARKEDLSLARSLADKLEAEVACSRPIVESEHWMAHERYIGVSGAIVKPEVYFAVGISGQVQHMVGVNQSQKIVAINKDKNAPVFKNADLGIVGDLTVVLPKIIAAL